MFFLLQMTGGEDAWIEQLAEARQAVIASKRPRYVTVLDLSDLVTDAMTREQIAAIRYRGPMYFDWDAAEIEATIEKVNQFRHKLVELGVDVESLRWYATGGRGFHCEIPQEVFLQKPPAKGTQYLPLIYREMAYSLYVDTMDMRVYSARSGRMWRTPNVQRENGRYKVPVTAAELAVMTPALYATLTTTPREEPTRTKPAFNPDLALMYEKARIKVEDGAKKRAKGGARDVELLNRFKGDWPPTVARLMSNECVKPGVGFHSIAMQIAITSNAIGKTEEATLAACDKLIENHVSDGSRYNTPRKRRDELARLLDYTRDNVCYSYSKGALKVLCADGVDTADLDGLPDDAGERLDDTPASSKDAPDLRGGIEMRETGLWKKDQENGIQLISDISFDDVWMLKSLPTTDKPSELWGYEAQVLLQGKDQGRQQIDVQCFLSKQRYQEFAMRNSGVMKGNDNDVAGLSTILRDMARKTGQVAYVVRREGLDYVTRPETNPPERELVWAETSGAYGAGGARMPYVFRPLVPSGSVYQADIQNAPLLTGSADELEYLQALFTMNDPSVVAPLLGWMTSCYHRAIYGALGARQFPLCSVWGQMGSGKSHTVTLFSFLHYLSAEPPVFSCASLSPYALKMHCAASASIPLLLDEYKPAEMKKLKIYEPLLLAMRSAYRADKFGSGGDGEQIGQGWKSLSNHAYSAPMLYIAEAVESQSAIMERTISIPVSKAGIVGRGKSVRRVEATPRVLSSVGRGILEHAFTIPANLPRFEALLQRNVEECAKLFKPDTSHRPVYNLGVMLTGFDIFSRVVQQHFGSALDSEIVRLRESILTEPAQTAGAIMAEASKVLDALAWISQNEDSYNSNLVKENHDYVFHREAGLPCIDLKMQNCFVKYIGWCRNKGQTPLYENLEQFCMGLGHYAPIVDKTCLNSPLKDSGLVRVYRFSLAKLTAEGVQQFKGQQNA